MKSDFFPLQEVKSHNPKKFQRDQRNFLIPIKTLHHPHAHHPHSIYISTTIVGGSKKIKTNKISKMRALKTMGPSL